MGIVIKGKEITGGLIIEGKNITGGAIRNSKQFWPVGLSVTGTMQDNVPSVGLAFGAEPIWVWSDSSNRVMIPAELMAGNSPGYIATIWLPRGNQPSGVGINIEGASGFTSAMDLSDKVEANPDGITLESSAGQTFKFPALNVLDTGDDDPYWGRLTGDKLTEARNFTTHVVGLTNKRLTVTITDIRGSSTPTPSGPRHTTQMTLGTDVAGEGAVPRRNAGSITSPNYTLPNGSRGVITAVFTAINSNTDIRFTLAGTLPLDQFPSAIELEEDGTTRRYTRGNNINLVGLGSAVDYDGPGSANPYDVGDKLTMRLYD